MSLLYQENIAYVRVTQLVGLVGLGWLPEALDGCLPVSCLAPGNVGWLPGALPGSQQRYNTLWETVWYCMTYLWIAWFCIFLNPEPLILYE